MANDLIRRYRRWFDYERDAHAKVLASLETVPADRRAEPEFRKAVAIFAHVVAGRRIWLGRFGVAPPLTGPLFPENPDLDRVAASWEETQELWSKFLASATETDLERPFEYQSLEGSRFRNQVEDILAQLFGHSSYHRGQIAMLVRAAGGEPAITDFVFWCREAIK